MFSGKVFYQIIAHIFLPGPLQGSIETNERGWKDLATVLALLLQPQWKSSSI